MLLLIASIGSIAFAYFSLSQWVASISICCLAFTAYLEFQGTAAKIKRFSLVVHSLGELIVWWDTLPQIDRSIVANIDHLVLSGEEILSREQQAWKSTSSAIKVMQKTMSKGHTSDAGDAGKME